MEAEFNQRKKLAQRVRKGKGKDQEQSEGERKHIKQNKVPHSVMIYLKYVCEINEILASVR